MAYCRALGLVKARGKQRTDSTQVAAAVRYLNRLELVGETLRAALHDLAVQAPDWVRTVAPADWYERYQRRRGESRPPLAAASAESEGPKSPLIRRERAACLGGSVRD